MKGKTVRRFLRLNRASMKELFETWGWTLGEVMALYGCSRASLYRELRESGIRQEVKGFATRVEMAKARGYSLEEVLWYANCSDEMVYEVGRLQTEEEGREKPRGVGESLMRQSKVKVGEEDRRLTEGLVRQNEVDETETGGFETKSNCWNCGNGLKWEGDAVNCPGCGEWNLKPPAQ